MIGRFGTAAHGVQRVAAIPGRVGVRELRAPRRIGALLLALRAAQVAGGPKVGRAALVGMRGRPFRNCELQRRGVSELSGGFHRRAPRGAQRVAAHLGAVRPTRCGDLRAAFAHFALRLASCKARPGCLSVVLRAHGARGGRRPRRAVLRVACGVFRHGNACGVASVGDRATTKPQARAARDGARGPRAPV